MWTKNFAFQYGLSNGFIAMLLSQLELEVCWAWQQPFQTNTSVFRDQHYQSLAYQEVVVSLWLVVFTSAISSSPILLDFLYAVQHPLHIAHYHGCSSPYKTVGWMIAQCWLTVMKYNVTVLQIFKTKYLSHSFGVPAGSPSSVPDRFLYLTENSPLQFRQVPDWLTVRSLDITLHRVVIFKFRMGRGIGVPS